MIDVYELLKKSIKFELIYTDEKGRQISFDSEILNILDDRILARYPVSLNDDFFIVKPMERLSTIVYTNEGVLSSNINFLENSDDGIYISFPYNNQFCQRRENSRTPLHVNFELEIINSGQGALNKYSTKTKNISGKGLACITEEPLPEFEIAKISLHFEDTDITIFGRKVYSKELNLNGESSYVNGIAFTKIEKEDVRIIMKKCLQFEIKAKHNERLFETL